MLYYFYFFFLDFFFNGLGWIGFGFWFASSKNIVEKQLVAFIALTLVCTPVFHFLLHGYALSSVPYQFSLPDLPQALRLT